MEESVDGAHMICLSTAEHHNTLLATPPKVDDHGTPQFHHPLLPTPSNYHDYCELSPPSKMEMQVRMSMIKKVTHRFGYWRLPTLPCHWSMLHLHHANLIAIVLVYLTRMTFYYLILLLFLSHNTILYSHHPP